jgi:hypothetical protein
MTPEVRAHEKGGKARKLAARRVVVDALRACSKRAAGQLDIEDGSGQRPVIDKKARSSSPPRPAPATSPASACTRTTCVA